ncbi:sulfate adenylyltransferase subunit CysN [Acinetobacter johnsonii]|jgi:sulfate adenylyltransferase subunit 1|uniref:Sulfate adenylyltransferase subunit 1 n=1 Tax=Acinetobacter johnsonii TaxID=40214 RepID=A0AA42XEJ8_ACIJO|nr:MULTISPECIES: sulfate adenylyltransferase subunit CysN [Acinetobacter]MBC6676138.1 sulfate adenylyltransferase subunit CysN [Acinetobacter sp.]MCU4325501.1 sulfate adenylyltransferase subunit CysN [Acinetobacter johnsonii]MDH0837039.1 sulfate adenylyltransferase subunit CysN [Acinetobacter johnsonii]MDH0840471.1 sulfate adenylyltransferase subunit CysN [Acinetobacter johnsonii]MDH2171424.1 sulfate adenylyltransferase subunit CysN [Acinetobacter johnsonii]
MSHQSELISQDILGYLKQHENKDLLRFLTCGNVDDGKSTLIGRLLYDSKLIYEDQLQAVTRDSKKVGTTGDAPDLALLVDGLQAEREQGITIDVAYRYFSTEKRKFIIADTPGHEQYTRNMATGASTCDLAIILIDARYGVQTQTRRHTYIASLLGIKNIIVAINKMDLVEFSEARFNEIQTEYAGFVAQLGDRKPNNIIFTPISALNGDNVVNKSPNTPWYTGETLMGTLESVEINRSSVTNDFRFPVQYVNRPNLDFRGFCGTVALGDVSVGDKIVALPSGKSSTIKEIVTYDGNLERAVAGQAVTLTLNDEIDISRGNVLVRADQTAPEISRSVNATVVWMADQPLVIGKLYNLKVGTQTVPAKVTAINYRTNVNTLEKVQVDSLELNAIANVTVEFDAPVVFDRYQDSRYTGSFIFIDRLNNVTIGAGMVEESVEWSAYSNPVTAEDRAARLGQKPAAVTVSVKALENAQVLENLLIQQGVVAIAKAGLTADQVALVRETGVVVVTDLVDGTDVAFTQDAVEELADKIVELVRL